MSPRLEKDMASPEARATIDENFKLAELMGMNGTPSYVIGKQVVVGAIGVEGLKEKIGIARCGKPTCYYRSPAALRLHFEREGIYSQR